eukprot:GHVH01008725.1.p1 GENE.GHVH01008725.1~~GHVH01008725.1.p1  ORF type:complete len:432 (+),score=34.11 GHVH01008725.1:42-1298(+)
MTQLQMTSKECESTSNQQDCDFCLVNEGCAWIKSTSQCVTLKESELGYGIYDLPELGSHVEPIHFIPWWWGQALCPLESTGLHRASSCEDIGGGGGMDCATLPGCAWCRLIEYITPLDDPSGGMISLRSSVIDNVKKSINEYSASHYGYDIGSFTGNLWSVREASHADAENIVFDPYQLISLITKSFSDPDNKSRSLCYTPEMLQRITSRQVTVCDHLIFAFSILVLQRLAGTQITHNLDFLDPSFMTVPYTRTDIAVCRPYTLQTHHDIKTNNDTYAPDEYVGLFDCRPSLDMLTSDSTMAQCELCEDTDECNVTDDVDRRLWYMVEGYGLQPLFWCSDSMSLPLRLGGSLIETATPVVMSNPQFLARCCLLVFLSPSFILLLVFLILHTISRSREIIQFDRVNRRLQGEQDIIMLS